MRIALSTLTCALVFTLSPRVAAQRPELRAHIDAYVAALSSGSADRFEAMAKGHFTPELLARNPDQRPRMVERVHADFGGLSIAGITMTGETHADVAVRSATNTMPVTIAMDFETPPPFRIAGVAIRAGGPAEDRGGRGGPPPIAAPRIDARMSDTELSTTLDGYLAGLARDGDFAGVVLVAKDGKAVFEKGYGPADRERNLPMSAEMRFNYASIGKAFTKAAIGQLIAAGRLKTSDTIGAWLPDYPNADAKPATIDQLLNFRVGIADFFGEAFAKADKNRFGSNHDYYTFLAPQPLKFAPGARTEYCNGCYVVLGEIIAKVSGMPYERYIQEHVFAPAGMKTAGFLSYGDPNVPPSYTRQGPGAPWLPGAGGHGRRGSAAGGSFGTVRDLLAFDNALRTHALFDARTTAWYFDNPEEATRARALSAMGIAGGARSANASMEANGVWTVIALGNLDPPNAERLATGVAGALYGRR